MRGITVVCLLSLAAVTMARPDDTYTDKYDNINVTEILENQRLLVPYLNCLKGTGKCTPEAKELKSHVTDALQTDCAKCTPTQRKRTKEVMGHLINKEPAVWEELKVLYDPTGTYSKKHEDELKIIKQ